MVGTNQLYNDLLTEFGIFKELTKRDEERELDQCDDFYFDFEYFEF